MEQINPVIFLEDRKTFMEILRVNNREVPFANLLAFFFRPKEKHGLGTLFIKALLNTKCSELCNIEMDTKVNILKNKGFHSDLNILSLSNLESNSIKVIVEQRVGQKRIDILIVADDFVICIEFKINHDLNNPLEQYRDFIKTEYPDKHHYFVILTPFKKDAIGEAKNFFVKNIEFKQVVLSHFFKQVKQELPSFYSTDNKTNRYYQYFEDFVQTVENRKIRSERFGALTILSQKLIDANFECDFHTKGFLEIKKQKFNYKVRIVSGPQSSGWQIEKWTKNKVKEEITILDCNLGYDDIVKEVKNFITKSFTSQIAV